MSAPRRCPAALTLTMSVAVSLAGCSSGGRPTSPGSPGSPAPTATLGSGSAGTSAEYYSTALRAAAGPVRSSLGGLARSRSMKSLNQRLERARTATGQAVDRLMAVRPPSGADTEHSDYVAALRGLEGDLGDLRDSVAGRRLCAPSAVLARLGKARGFGAVRSAAGDLMAKGGYPADLGRMKTPKERSRRLANGAFVRRGPRSGLARLVVKNSRDRDTVLSLVRGRTAVTRFYIRKNRTVTVSGVPDGTYRIFYTSGVDWDRGARAFTRDCAFKRFDRSLRFSTIVTATQRRSSGWRITLRPVISGNATTSEVDPDDFPA